MLKQLRSFKRRLHSRLAPHAWFPRVPLALAVGLLGFLYLLPLIEHTLGWHIVSTLLSIARQDLVDLTLWGIPQFAIGIFMLIMAVALLLRSRIAWTASIVIIVAGLAFTFIGSKEPVHWWRVIYNAILLALLLPAYRHFDRRSTTLGTLFAAAAVLVFLGFAVFGSYRLGDQFDPPITDLTTALYFTVITISSVGFGDITPVSSEARLFLVSMIIIGIVVFGTALGATIVPAVNRRIEQLTVGRHSKMTRNNHYIIVGYNALASNTHKELIARGEEVTLIMRTVPEGTQLTDADVVIGDGSDLDTLRAAGGENAKAILALLNDDSENAFVVLAAKELKGKPKTVAAVNDVRNLARIRRVHPYLIIAPQVLGGELLTMALTGEKIDAGSIIQRMLGQATSVSGEKP
jgi:voltage-gated potassium channel